MGAACGMVAWRRSLDATFRLSMSIFRVCATKWTRRHHYCCHFFLHLSLASEDECVVCSARVTLFINQCKSFPSHIQSRIHTAPHARCRLQIEVPTAQVANHHKVFGRVLTAVTDQDPTTCRVSLVRAVRRAAPPLLQPRVISARMSPSRNHQMTASPTSASRQIRTI